MIEVEAAVLEPRGEIVQVPPLGIGHPDAAQCLGVGGEQLSRCGHPIVVERLEPSQDRRGGGERELLADHLQDERSPEVAGQAVEEAVGVQGRLRVDQVRHPRVRHAQQLAPGRPPVGAASRMAACSAAGLVHRGRSRTTSVGVLVVAQPEEARLPQAAVVGPLGEPDLGDELGPGPVRPPGDRPRVDERGFGRLADRATERRGRGASPPCTRSRPYPRI